MGWLRSTSRLPDYYTDLVIRSRGNVVVVQYARCCISVDGGSRSGLYLYSWFETCPKRRSSHFASEI